MEVLVAPTPVVLRRRSAPAPHQPSADGSSGELRRQRLDAPSVDNLRGVLEALPRRRPLLSHNCREPLEGIGRESQDRDEPGPLPPHKRPRRIQLGIADQWLLPVVVKFERSTPTTHAAREFAVDVGGTSLSGLLAEPVGSSDVRALVVAIHGLGMHAGYFDATAHPGLSLLELGSQLGFTVW